MRKVWFIVITLLVGIPVYGQAGTPYQVYRTTSTSGNTIGQDTITFVNLLTGTSTSVDLYGDSYTLLEDQVLAYNRLEDQVVLLHPDGTMRPHPFIQPTPTTYRIDWTTDSQRRYLAWTITEGTPDALTTVTRVANVDGSEAQEILVDGPRRGILALPVTFSSDASALYMDYQPDQIGDFTPYSEYAGLFAVNFKAAGEVAYMPGEPGCFCGAGFGADFFLRLALADDLSGFNLRVVNLNGNAETLLNALPLNNYTQGGDVLIAPDGTRAVYALAQVNNFGSPNQSTRTVFVLVDLTTLTQSQLTSPITRLVRPVAWTDDNAAVIFSEPEGNGTWKVALDDPRLVQVAAASYLGRVNVP